MMRTQISLNKEEYQMAKIEAKRQGLSLAELLRRSLRNFLPISKNKPWMKFVGFVESGNSCSSQNIDNIIYGQKD
ncbi:MAG: hypothetical protein A3G32_03135 [Deltaproteobacteria bacterium RIFCSPLOWO2_12_FULL_40_28]|nr:MAG: hypothetical protein A3C45_01820 [Deltaproteobacteria bacterium RIFCSPHIGHO2_02_FULL_40_28]OGQ19493.1 MAG: hypothetical protein A3E27_02040 [Deltaproteobacteria bacterium RIFCSPHIGHO2_12_FULL_40_32]OGQ39967.1 MAG: hypothetical protein A3I69_08005 [Deltaproteobacteria bacterium RIFCSPLOWO2_02_FULL_40_36]OGQ54359.1 MAG: hypothetical protein A3G32_03135 [Deltaproteobacteria bacterium RIFCSPLOWO2_12_FULL_40_28]